METTALYNLESEKSVLGAMLISKKVCNDACSLLLDDDFYDSKSHRVIFRAIKAVYEENNEASCTSVVLELQNNMKMLEEVGGTTYIYELTELYVGDKDAEYHMGKVHDLGLLRRLFATAEKLQKDFLEKEVDDISDFIETYDTKINEITKNRASGEFKSTDQVIANIERDMKENSKKGNDGLVGVDTGFSMLNNYTGGWQGGQLIILGARPSVGKTALAINFLYNAARKGTPVAFFSLEMSAEDIIRRLLANRSAVSFKAIKTGLIQKDEDWMALDEAKRDINKCKIFVDDTSGIKIGEIKTKCTKLKSKYPDLGLIIIDYMGLINVADSRKETREKIDEISRSLKGLARDLDVPIICLCQLSRSNEKDKRKPMLSDLRDSGSIEQDADIVMFIHRDSYQKNEEPSTGDQDNSIQSTQAEIIVAKNRNGQTGVIQTNFMLAESRFYDITKG